jgi:AraC-like DNA-binding protein
MTVGQPLRGVEILSARGSTRHWSEPVHGTYTVAAILPGQITGAEWRTRGRSCTTVAGQLMNINPGDGHHTVRVHAPAAFDVVKLAPWWIERAAAEFGVRGPFWFGSSTCSNEAVSLSIRALMAAVSQDESEFVVEAACHDLTYALLTELGEASHAPSGGSQGSEDPRILRVHEFLVEDPSARASLDVLASETGLGKSQLCALFKKRYGMSIGQYRTGWRIAASRKLLLEDVAPKCVALDLGFTDEAHFSRMFRRHHGAPPRAWVSLYRRNSRTGHSKPLVP